MLAAILGTAAEVGCRCSWCWDSARGSPRSRLFVFNIVAATSYPDLPAGLKDHILWGALMMVTFFYGPGRIALDHWLGRRFGV